MGRRKSPAKKGGKKAARKPGGKKSRRRDDDEVSSSSTNAKSASNSGSGDDSSNSSSSGSNGAKPRAAKRARKEVEEKEKEKRGRKQSDATRKLQADLLACSQQAAASSEKVAVSKTACEELEAFFKESKRGDDFRVRLEDGELHVKCSHCDVRIKNRKSGAAHRSNALRHTCRAGREAKAEGNVSSARDEPASPMKDIDSAKLVLLQCLRAFSDGDMTTIAAFFGIKHEDFAPVRLKELPPLAEQYMSFIRSVLRGVAAEELVLAHDAGTILGRIPVEVCLLYYKACHRIFIFCDFLRFRLLYTLDLASLPKLPSFDRSTSSFCPPLQRGMC